MDYVIGDVQGCFDSLQALLKKINFNKDRDRLHFLGDVVNRGNKSLETLRFIYSLKDNANMVLGNHDFHLLVCALTPQKPNKKDTFLDILDSRDRSSLIDYLLTRPLFIEYKDVLFVHAGVPPQWNELDVIKNTELVHRSLRGNNPGEFLSKMYKNEPVLFKNELTKEEKSLREDGVIVIHNYLPQNDFEGLQKEFDNQKNYEGTESIIEDGDSVWSRKKFAKRHFEKMPFTKKFLTNPKLLNLLNSAESRQLSIPAVWFDTVSYEKRVSGIQNSSEVETFHSDI